MDKNYFIAKKFYDKSKEYTDELSPHTISETVLQTVTASNIIAGYNENDKTYSISIAEFDIIPNKRYYIEFMGKKILCSNSIDTTAGSSILCNFKDYDVEIYSTDLDIHLKNVDSIENMTDLKIICEEVKLLDSKYLETDLTIQNSIGMGRTGDIGYSSTALGYLVESSGPCCYAEGERTKAVNVTDHAEGYRTKAKGGYSHAEGYYTEANGIHSHAEGYYSHANADSSHAEGSSEASGEYAHSENTGTASGQCSHAEGRGTQSSGIASHSEGEWTIASSNYQHVQGKFNTEDTENKYAHIIGNGTNSNNRSNAHTLDWEGNAWYSGKLSQDGTPTEDNDLTTKKYVDGCFGDESAEVVFSNTWTLNEMVNDDVYVLENPIEHHIKPFLEAYYIIEVTLKNNEKVRFTSNEANSQSDDWIDIYAEDGYINYTIYVSRYTYPEGESQYLGLELYDSNWNYITDAKSIKITEKRLHMIEQNQIKSVNFDAIKNMDGGLQDLVDNNTKAIKTAIYSSLVNGYSKECDFDMSLYNESPYDTSTKSNILDGSGIKVTTKESDGIEKASGFKLSLPINNNYYFAPNLTDYWYSGKNNLVATLVTVTDGVITVKDTSKYGDNIYLFISSYSKKANTEYYILFRCKDDEDYAYIYPKYAGLVKSADYKDLRKIMFMNNKVEYTPTEDYNPATKKYVDDSIASSGAQIDETELNNMLNDIYGFSDVN